MYRIIYFIILLVFGLTYYTYISTYKNNNEKHMMIQFILEEWKTNVGFVEPGTGSHYPFDYYLNLQSVDDYSSHIHLITTVKDKIALHG